MGIDGEELLVDVGRARVRAGMELSLIRTMEARHPVTHRLYRDRFVIGRIRIVQPGETLSLARVAGTPTRQVQVGDAVESEGPATATATATTTAATPPTDASAACASRVCPTCPTCTASSDPESAEIIAFWRASLGRPPAERIALCETFLRRNPRSPHAAAVADEIAALRGVGQEPAPLTPPTPEQLRQTRLVTLVEGVRAQRLTRAHQGVPVVMGVDVDPEAGATALVLLIRGHDGGNFARIPMTIAGHNARAAVPSRFVEPPGFDYFIGVVGEAGDSAAAVGAADEPQVVEVIPRMPTEPVVNRSRVRFSTEFVSFNNAELNDWYVATEGDFLYRTLFHQLYGVRLGYGHILGKGGTVEDLDVLGLDPRPVGFTYGYIESELQLHELFAVVARVTIGLGRQEPADDEGLRGGFSMRLRIGPEDGTNLLIAGETIPEIGQRAYVGLHWEVIEDWPMQAEVHVTDQPVSSDELGVRGVFELGYQATDAMALSARLSYQGRNIDHAGLGAGLAATFDW